MRKFKLTSESRDFREHTLHRIQALVDFGCVKAGNLGDGLRRRKTFLKMTTHGSVAMRRLLVMRRSMAARG